MGKMIGTCESCKVEFAYCSNANKGRFCSYQCYWNSMRGVCNLPSRSGQEPWNKGQVGVYSEETRKRMGAKNKGRKHTEEFKAKLSARMKGNKGIGEFWKGKKRPADWIAARSKEKSHLWRGGIDGLNKTERYRIMKTKEYRDWRKSVFERDNYTCQKCKKRGVRLQAHHIKPFAKYPELRVVVDNGVTLCLPCHDSLRVITLMEIRSWECGATA